MSDLHERLKFAVDIRLVLARAATEGPWEYTVVQGKAYVGRPDTLPSVAEVEFETDVHHILANAPDAVIRHCEADLRRLERHWRNGAACEACWRVLPDRTEGVPWPCMEIRDLAAAYGIEVQS